MDVSSSTTAPIAAQHRGPVQVLEKALDLQKQEGQAAVSLIEAAGTVRVPPPPGDGSGRVVNVLA